MTSLIKRKIIEIDRNKCDGCGLCVTACAEGAIQVIDGKAHLVSEIYCDGLGDCLEECPQDAISIVEKEASPFDHDAVEEHLSRLKNEVNRPNYSVKGDDCSAGTSETVSPCCAARELSPAGRKHSSEEEHEAGLQSELSNWPVQIHLVPPGAPFLRNPQLLIAADCVPFACANFHRQILKDRALLIGCPKLDDTGAYLNKLTEILRKNTPQWVTVAIMEVPCCNAMVRLVEQAIKDAGSEAKLNKIVIGVDGAIKE